ncbi:MAG: PDZ domain-containing protein [Armatimonadetes bacterium]|nr:PDZ domain-containing protein [Armatimonadota bacterium]
MRVLRWPSPRLLSLWALLAVIASVSLASSGLTQEIATDSDHFEQTVQQAISRVKPALIRIMVVEANYDEGRESKDEAAGSGVVISPEGYAVTNHHVAGEAKSMVVTLSTKEELDATLVGTDPLSDIAVIKLKGAPGRKFATAEFADYSSVRVGDRVLAMGSPFALSQSVTTGMVSNVEMIMPEFMWPFNKLELSGEDVGSMVRWIGHDALIAGGNSGGPLVNLQGQIIGINEIDFALSGAIPSNIVRDVAEQIIKNGHVVRSWLGIDIQPLLKSSTLTVGALVGGIVADSPASKAGLKSGDIIKQINGKPVTVRFGEDVPIFNQTIAALPVNQPVEILVSRNGKDITVRPTTVEREEAEPKERELKAWGITVRNISSPIARDLGRDKMSGAMVTGVTTSGPAADAKPPIQDKDVIVKVGGRPIKSVAELVKVTSDVIGKSKERVPALVEFDRKTERYVTVVRLGIDPLRDPGLEAAKAWVPIGTQVLTSDVAQALGIAETQGVRVTEVYPNHSAAKAGLKVGDIITKLDGEQIEASQPQDFEVFPAMVREKTIGDMARLSVLREKKPMTIEVELEPSPKLPREMKRYRSEAFEFTARNATFSDKDRRRSTGATAGVVVESVDAGGWAAVGRLAVGDKIVSVQHIPVENVQQLSEEMDKVRQQEPRSVVFQVKRGNTELFVEIQPDWTVKQ